MRPAQRYFGQQTVTDVPGEADPVGILPVPLLQVPTFVVIDVASALSAENATQPPSVEIVVLLPEQEKAL